MAIVTSESLDATTVDPATVIFAGAQPRHWALEDVDGDGDLDLILNFRCRELDIDPDAEQACLSAYTYGGTYITGCDSVKIVPTNAPADSDTDEFLDAVEICTGTDPLDGCPDDLSDDAWPPDINMDAVVDVVDVVLFLNAFPSAQGSPNYSGRLDMAENNAVIDVIDAVAFLVHYPSACTKP